MSDDSDLAQESLRHVSKRTDRLIGQLVDPPERVVAVIHPHWWLIITPAGVMLVGVVISIVLSTFGIALLNWAALVVIAIALLHMGLEALKWYFEVLFITDRRVMLSRGVLLRHTSEIPLKHVNDITTTQGILGRIFHFGQLRIESANANGQELATFVPNPVKIRQLLSNLSLGMESEAPTSSGGGDALTRLERLSLLYLNGLLTSVEYEQAKKVVLGQELGAVVDHTLPTERRWDGHS
ncbi:MAG: PH domain-containing protein [Ferrimicrobium sp.]